MFTEIMFCFRNAAGQPSVFPNSAFHYLGDGVFVFSKTPIPVIGTNEVALDYARISVSSLVAITTEMERIAQWLQGKLEDEELRNVIQRD